MNNLNLLSMLSEHLTVNPLYKELLESISKVMQREIEYPTKQIAKIRDSNGFRVGEKINDPVNGPGFIKAIFKTPNETDDLYVDFGNGDVLLKQKNSLERKYLISTSEMLGLKFYSNIISQDDYQRINKYISMYWPEGGTIQLANFIGFIKNIRFELIELWTNYVPGFSDGSYVYPSLEEFSNVMSPVWEGGSYFPTSHVEIRYDINSENTPDLSEIRQLFYLLAPIDLVLQRISATVYGELFFYKQMVGVGQHYEFAKSNFELWEPSLLGEKIVDWWDFTDKKRMYTDDNDKIVQIVSQNNNLATQFENTRPEFNDRAEFTEDFLNVPNIHNFDKIRGVLLYFDPTLAKTDGDSIQYLYGGDWNATNQVGAFIRRKDDDSLEINYKVGDRTLFGGRRQLLEEEHLFTLLFKQSENASWTSINGEIFIDIDIETFFDGLLYTDSQSGDIDAGDYTTTTFDGDINGEDYIYIFWVEDFGPEQRERWWIGSLGGANNRLNTDIKMMFFLSDELTVEEIKKIEGWVAWKFKNTSILEASHPYKNLPPMV